MAIHSRIAMRWEISRQLKVMVFNEVLSADASRASRKKNVNANDAKLEDLR